MSVTEQLAQFVVDTRWDTVPETARRKATQCILDCVARWPQVKGLFTHSVTYNCCRQEDTWLDR